MKRLFMIATMVCAFVAGAFAQQMPPIPFDQNVKVGTLPNGLTYYLRHNEWPEKRVNFYIAQKVGSIQEEDNQRGLAHFLEHMCFNGTTHFPGDGIKQYLEGIGVKFGENLNAYTSVEETVYNIDNVNVEIPGAMDSCLLILHDWSHDLLLEDKEIDKERGVINEEWRMRSSAMMRMYEKGLPLLYPNCRYGERLPIGTMDVVMNFKYDALRSYYRKWYRPDLQGLVIVGDFDVDEMEKKIQTVFADIQPAPADAAPLVGIPVPDNDEPIVVVLSDKEQQQNIATMMWKDDAFPREMKGNMQYLVTQYIIDAMESMFNERIGDIVQKPNPPFLGASFSYGHYLFSSTKNAFGGDVAFENGQHKEAIKALYREILRIKKHGFNVSEYERFKSEYLSQIEKAYNRRDKVYSKQYVNECVRHFLDNEPMPGIEFEYQIANQLAPNIPVEAVNQICAQIPENNFVMAVFMPEKEGTVLPTKEELLAIKAEVEAEDIEALVEEVNTDPLIAVMPTPGTVKSIKDEAFDAKLITLSNGIKVHVKKTDFSPNQISMTATSWGGTAMYSNDEYGQTKNIDQIGIGGWGNFSATDLQKKLSGIQASASPFVGDNTEGINGSCVKKDFETMLQLTYLCFTAPRKDVEAFQSHIQRSKAQLANQELNPMVAFSDTISKVLYNNNVRSLRTKAEDLDKIDYDRIIELYKERFADADDFEFFIIGDCDADTIAPLLAQYLGALPTLKGAEKQKVIDRRLTKGEVTNVFEKEQQTPNSVTLFVYHAPLKETLKSALTIDMLEQVMTELYTETVREDEGGAYGVPVSSAISIYPEQIGIFQIQLPTAPDKRERMTEVVYQGVEKIIAEGPKDESVNKIKEYMIRKHAESIKTNGYWMSVMMKNARYGKDFSKDYEKTVNSITKADIQQMAKLIFKSGNRLAVGMTSPAK